LVMNNFEKLMGAQTDPGDSTDYTFPKLTFPAGGPEVGSIFDNFALPTDIAAGYTIDNCLPLRMYNLIWNEWFRDQNLQDSVLVSKDDGPDAPADFTLLKRGRRHDYFTSALPWPQKGPAVELPLGTSAPITGLGTINQVYTPTNLNSYQTDGTAAAVYAKGKQIGSNTAVFDTHLAVEEDPNNTGYPNIRADLTQATAATINQLREAFQVQALYEVDARGGTRFIELIQAHFQVSAPDFRLQRPEYLGGGSATINTHPVPQTAPTSGSNPQAQLAAFATSASNGTVGFSKSFQEHGYVIGLMCPRSEITYQQGLNRFWSYEARFDLYWPKFAELGEQAILNKEIYLQGTSADDDVFGYQERFAHLRYSPSEITGQFRSTYATSLDFWHMAEEFATLPALNATFIEQNTPIERAIAVTDSVDLLCDFWFNFKHARRMPVRSVPLSLGKM